MPRGTALHGWQLRPELRGRDDPVRSELCRSAVVVDQLWCMRERVSHGDGLRRGYVPPDVHRLDGAVRFAMRRPSVLAGQLRLVRELVPVATERFARVHQRLV